MKGTVTKLCDLESIRIPEEMLTVCVDTRQVEQQVQNLSLRYAEQIPVEVAQKGDIVSCGADPESYPDGRTILLYTGLNIPGAESAAAAVTGKRVGESISTVLAGRAVKLVIEKITRPVPVAVDDALIASIGIEGVTTVDAYRGYVTDQKMAEMQMENHKMAMSEVMSQMIAGSSFVYEEAEIDRYLTDHMEEIEEEYRAGGMELPAREQLREVFLEQSKQGWVAEAFCRQNGIEIDRASVEADADQMMEMLSIMGERVPDREQMIEESLCNAYVVELFQKIDAYLTQKMEG